MQNKFNINDSIEYLKQGQVLKTISTPLSFFVLIDEKIWVYSEQTRFHMSVENFLILYQFEFFLIHTKKKVEEMSLDNDDEYYRWRQ